MKHGIQMGRRSAFLINHLSLLQLPAKVASPDLSKRDQAIFSFNLRPARYQTDSEEKRAESGTWSSEPGSGSALQG